MSKAVSKVRRVGVAGDYIDGQLSTGRVCLSLPGLITATGLSSTAATYQLLRLGKRVARISHQFYLIVSPEHFAIGAPPPNQWLDDYFKWLRHPYYLALQSAAATYGTSPQAIQVTQVMTDAPRRPIGIGRLRIHFFVKRNIEKTATGPLANAFAPLQVSTPAATVFDLVRYAPRIGGIGRAVETLKPLLTLVSERELRAVLVAEHETASAQRLGYIVEKSGRADLANVVDDWLPGKLPLTRLVSTDEIPTKAQRIARWQVHDNSGEFSP